MDNSSAMRATIAAAATFVLATTLLAGCSAAPEPPSPSTVPSESPSSAPTPTVEPIDTVVAIVARPEALELRDASGGVVVELGYLGDVDSAIATIEGALGAAPVDEEYPGSSHVPPSTAHRWGAFELWEHRYVDNWADFATQERTLYMPSFGIMFTGPEVAGVALTTEQGVVAGSSWSVLEAMPGLQENPSGCSGPYLDFTSRDVTWPDGTVHEERHGVDFVATDDRSAIERVRAPLQVNQESCA
ncbi:hypothetical protein [Agromyces laixinhei]|uniref:hypothetical protein n=1 Tax=Agromyces laixinhei TaxID=2585717 RepID=UPI0011160FDE|nr:hypothetical protein [Agromyces laixinhei]